MPAASAAPRDQYEVSSNCDGRSQRPVFPILNRQREIIMPCSRQETPMRPKAATWQSQSCSSLDGQATTTKWLGRNSSEPRLRVWKWSSVGRKGTRLAIRSRSETAVTTLLDRAIHDPTPLNPERYWQLQSFQELLRQSAWQPRSRYREFPAHPD